MIVGLSQAPCLRRLFGRVGGRGEVWGEGEGVGGRGGGGRRGKKGGGKGGGGGWWGGGEGREQAGGPAGRGFNCLWSWRTVRLRTPFPRKITHLRPKKGLGGGFGGGCLFCGPRPRRISKIKRFAQNFHSKLSLETFRSKLIGTQTLNPKP